MGDPCVNQDGENTEFYGGLEGPNSKYIKFIAEDGHEFVIPRKDALVSSTLKNMLSGPGEFSEKEENKVHLKLIPSYCVSRLCNYFQYKTRYTNSSVDIPEFFIKPEIALELLMTSNFLDC